MGGMRYLTTIVSEHNESTEKTLQQSLQQSFRLYGNRNRSAFVLVLGHAHDKRQGRSKEGV